jgi:uncharacterized membrane protein
MIWYIWALLAMVASSCETIIDKAILIKKPEKIDFLVAMFYRNFWFFIGIALIGITGFMGKLSFIFNVPFLVLAIIYPLTSFSYDYFLRNNEVSRFSAIFRIFPIFFFAFDKLFFHSSFSFIQIIGILLLVIGAMIFSIDIKKNKSSFSGEGWFWMFVYMGINMYLYVVFKISSRTINGVSFYFSIWALMMLVYVLSLVLTRKYLKMKETALADNFLVKTIVSKGFDSLGGVFYLQAISLSSLTLASAFNSFSPLVLLTILLFVSLATRTNLKEDFSKNVVWQKVIATALLIIGGLCVFVP